MMSIIRVIENNMNITKPPFYTNRVHIFFTFTSSMERYSFKIIADGNYIPYLMTIRCSNQYECQRKVFNFLLKNNFLVFSRGGTIKNS